ncbi:hypothetical protein, partial [Yersinia similis]|uniref:hypothetical protein n=1 Tax=Yersinia similis TaxID=367190 RepID=UPI000AC8ED47
GGSAGHKAGARTDSGRKRSETLPCVADTAHCHLPGFQIVLRPYPSPNLHVCEFCHNDYLNIE